MLPRTCRLPPFTSALLALKDKSNKGWSSCNRSVNASRAWSAGRSFSSTHPSFGSSSTSPSHAGIVSSRFSTRLSGPLRPMKGHPKIIDRILEGIQGSESICVVGHVRPDGDCIGSQLGLSLALLNAGKKVCCWNQDPIPQKLAFLDTKKLMGPPETGHPFDCVIATDAASLERLGAVGECITDRKLFINIDHHKSNTRF